MWKAIRYYVRNDEFNALHKAVQVFSRADAVTTDALLDGLESTSWRIRMRCLQGLAKATPEARVVQAVASHLNDPQESVAEAAAWAVAALGEPARAHHATIARRFGQYVADDDLHAAKSCMRTLLRLPSPLPELVMPLRTLATRYLEGDIDSYRELADDVYRALARFAPDEATVSMLRRVLAAGGVGTEGAAVAILRLLDDPTARAEALLPVVVGSPSATGELAIAAGETLGASYPLSVKAVRAIVERGYDRWNDWAAATRLLERDSQEMVYRLAPAGGPDAWRAWLDDALPVEVPERDEVMARVVVSIAQRHARDQNFNVEIEHTFAGKRIAHVTGESEWFLFVDHDIPFDAPAERLAAADAELVASLRKHHADGRYPNSGYLRVSPADAELKISWGTVAKRWLDGRIESFPEWGSGWTTDAEGVGVEEFKALALDQMRLTAAEIGSWGYDALLIAAETPEDWQHLADHFRRVLELAELRGHRLATWAKLGLARCLAGQHDEHGALALLDELQQALTPKHILGESGADDVNHTMAQVVTLRLEVSQARGWVRVFAEGLAKQAKTNKAKHGKVIPPKVARRVQDMIAWLRPYPEMVQISALEQMAQRSQNAVMLHLLGAELARLEDGVALGVLERALSFSSGRPTPELLGSLETLYLKLGRADDAARVVQMRARSGAKFAEVNTAHRKETGFDINAALARMTEVVNACYRIQVDTGTLVKHEALAREGGLLQEQVIDYWTPHELSGNPFPMGRAVSQASANYIECLCDLGKHDEAVAYFRRTSANIEVTKARFRDFPGPAESYVMCGLVACLDAQNADDLAYAGTMRDFVVRERLDTLRAWSLEIVARVYAREGRGDEALQMLRLAVARIGADFEALRSEVEGCPDFADLVARPEWAKMGFNGPSK